MPLLSEAEDSEIPNLRPCRPETTEPGLASTTESLRLFSMPSFLTGTGNGTEGLLGGTGGGTPLPNTGFRLMEAAEDSEGGFRVTETDDEDAAAAGADFNIVPGLETPI